MSKRYAVMLPNSSQRHQILKILLKKTRLADNFSFDFVVERTEGRSGSDLKEMCRTAAMAPLREYLRSQEGIDAMKNVRAKNRAATDGGDSTDSLKSSTASTPPALKHMRPVRTEDFFRTESMEVPKGVDFLLNERPAHAHARKAR